MNKMAVGSKKMVSNKEKNIRIGIIGAGSIAKLNTAALLAVPGVEIAAITNHHPEKAEALAKELGISCPVFADWKEMLREDLDAAAVFLPHDLHLPAFLDCAAAGVDLFIEKPLGRTTEECGAMIRAVKEAGIRACVCHTQRYNAIYIAAVEYMRTHPELGALRFVTDRIDCDYYWDGRPAWQLSKERSGDGPILNYGVHQLDRVHYLIREAGKSTAKPEKESSGKVEKIPRIVVRRDKPGIETCSAFSMQGESEDGVSYSITFSGYSGPFINETTLHFENGTILCELTENGGTGCGLFVCRRGEMAFSRISPLLPNTAHDMYVRQFAAAVQELRRAEGMPGRQADGRAGNQTEDSTEPHAESAAERQNGFPGAVSLSWAAEMVRLAGG